MALAIAIYLAFMSGGAGSAAPDPTADASQRANEAVSQAGIEPRERAAIEAIVRDYILKNPEVIPEAITILQNRSTQEKLASAREPLETPYPGAILGNPEGTVTLVEFSDYACGYCRASKADVERLVAENKDLKIVIRELPILSDASRDAAKWALAAADQGKFAAFHHALFDGGRPGEASILAAAAKARLDLVKAREAVKSERITDEIASNMGLAQTLGFGGTPSWIVGDKILEGAVGYDQLSAAVEAARR